MSSSSSSSSRRARRVAQTNPKQQTSNRKSASRDLSPSKGVSFGFVLEHKIFKGVDPEGCVRYLTRSSKNQSLRDVWDSLEDYEAEKDAEKDVIIPQDLAFMQQ